MTEETQAADNAGPANLAFTIQDSPETNPITVEIDRAKIPAAARLDLLDRAIKSMVNNRPHVALMRYNAALKDYKAKCDADPTFEGEAPVAPNLAELAQAAIADLYAGKLQQRNRNGNAKQKAAKDPVDAVVTQAVIREMFAKRKAETPGTKYQDVVKLVGESGVVFLQNRAKELAGGNEKRLEELNKQIESKYLAPARKMVSVNKAGESQENELL
jgi:hypothetical protein